MLLKLAGNVCNSRNDIPLFCFIFKMNRWTGTIIFLLKRLFRVLNSVQVFFPRFARFVWYLAKSIRNLDLFQAILRFQRCSFYFLYFFNSAWQECNDLQGYFCVFVLPKLIKWEVRMTNVMFYVNNSKDTVGALSITRVFRISFFVSAANYSHLKSQFSIFFPSAWTLGYFLAMFKKINFFKCLKYTCSLPHRRVHEIKRMYLASRIHGLFIT